MLASSSRPFISPTAKLVENLVKGRCFLIPLLSGKNLSVLGAGFTGLSTTWHLLQHNRKDVDVFIDIYDEFGIAGGVSGASGGLLHPYSPKVKPLCGSVECWKESLKLLSVAEAAVETTDVNARSQDLAQIFNGFIVPIESIDKDAAEKLVPNLCVPFNSAIYMPEGVTVHVLCYLEALHLACQNLVKDASISGFGGKELNLQKKLVLDLLELSEEYDAVIICLGARAAFLPELSGKLPLRTCRSVIAHLHLPHDIRTRPFNLVRCMARCPWSPQCTYIGSTWEWKSTNYCQNVPAEEASKALEELLHKASAIYPGIKNWEYTGASAGLRAMPPITSTGALPLLGCIDDFISVKHACKFWFFTGLGSMGLFYHGWLGKLMAEAVFSCNENVIPSELSSWKSLTKQ